MTMHNAGAYDALDSEELFRLALYATNNNDSPAAINLLKQAVERDGGHAKAAWLLGAEYAQIGMVDRALAALQRAVEIDPTLVGARFQLGLLHLTSGNVAVASEVWAPLDAQPEGDAYRLFKTGMLQMVADDFDRALITLRRCRELPGVDAPLKRDVEMVIAQIEARQQAPREDTAGETSANQTEPQGAHLFLTAYHADAKR